MLIGIHGKAGVGKDLAAAILIGQHGGRRFAFADPVREIAATLFALDPSDFQTQEQKQMREEYWGMSRRYMLQLVGTEMVREVVGKDHWIKLMDLRRHLNQYASHHYITDCRFDNEIQYVLDAGGFILHIESNSRSSIKYASSEAAHASEKALDMSAAIKYNRYCHIQNDGTMDVYRNQVLDAYDTFESIKRREGEIK